MLKYLHIQGLALIDEMELTFKTGVNALTGESGAGKSFILKAIDFVIGEKLSVNMIRPGRPKAEVEASFTVNEQGIDKEITLRREITASGRTRFFLNDTVVTQEHIRNLQGNLLLHVCQHGQQKLLHPSYQLSLIDDFLQDKTLLSWRDDCIQKLKEVDMEKKELAKKIENLQEKRQLMEYQQQEINKVHPAPGEEEKLESLATQHRNMAKRSNLYENGLLLLLGENGDGLEQKISELEHLLSSLAHDDPYFNTFLNSASSFYEDVRELSQKFRSTPIPEENYSIDKIEERLYEFSQLKRKLKKTIPEILQLKDTLEKHLSFLDSCSLDMQHLTKKEILLAQELDKTVTELNKQRKTAAELFCSSLEKELSELGFSETIRVIPEKSDYALWEIEGNDTINKTCIEERYRLLWAPNPGIPAQPLDKIASGGELSRFLLAVVSLQAANNNTTLIFDEIDAGVGGITLNHIATKMQQLSTHRQVLLITHWPKLAECATNHFFVSKKVMNGDTFTLCELLNDDTKKKELKRMAGEYIEAI